MKKKFRLLLAAGIAASAIAAVPLTQAAADPWRPTKDDPWTISESLDGSGIYAAYWCEGNNVRIQWDVSMLTVYGSFNVEPTVTLTQHGSTDAYRPANVTSRSLDSSGTIWYVHGEEVIEAQTSTPYEWFGIWSSVYLGPGLPAVRRTSIYDEPIPNCDPDGPSPD